MSSKIQQVNLNNTIQKQAIKKEEKKPVSNVVKKDPSKTEYLKMASILFSGALLACGGMGLAYKAYSKVSDDILLGSKIKKDEISQELFAFLKRFSKENKYYFSKEQVLKLNENLTEENIPIFKALLKTDIASPYRVDKDEIVSITQAMNEQNSKYIIDIAKQYDDIYDYQDGDIAKILKSITKDNGEFVNMILSKAKKTRYEEPDIKMADKIVAHLSKITKDNVETYRTIEGLRKDGKYSSFKLDEIDSLVEVFKKGQNEEMLKYLSSLKATNGVDYRFSGQDLKEMLQGGQDEFMDLYKTCVKKYGDNAKHIISKMTRDNKKTCEILINTQNKDFISKCSGDKISEIIEQSASGKNIKTLKFLINLSDGEKFVFEHPNERLVQALSNADDKYLDVYQSLKSSWSFVYKNLIGATNKDTVEFIRKHFPEITSVDVDFLTKLNAERVAFADKFINYSGNKNIPLNYKRSILDKIFKISDEHPEKTQGLYKAINQTIENGQEMSGYDWYRVIENE